MKTGFTLIELLVVVLIIGILAAVALPQYEWAVEKSRAAEAFSVLKTVREAQEVYYMANGAFPPSLNDLDIPPPTSKHFNYQDGGISVAAYHKTKPYLLAYRNSLSIKGGQATLVCGTDYTDAKNMEYAVNLCKRLGADTSVGGTRWPIVK